MHGFRPAFLHARACEAKVMRSLGKLSRSRWMRTKVQDPFFMRPRFRPAVISPVADIPGLSVN